MLVQKSAEASVKLQPHYLVCCEKYYACVIVEHYPDIVFLVLIRKLVWEIIDQGIHYYKYEVARNGKKKL